MRRLRYCVAMSLDGFIAGPNGEHDWIAPDPAIDFAALWVQFDTAIMGRKTYEIAKTRRELFSGSAPRWVVVSATLNPQSEPDIELIADRLPEKVAALKSEPGKDIWLFGGGVLFRSLLDAALVDTVELTVLPILLGSGTPLLAEGDRAMLNLTDSKTLPSGTLILKYSIVP